MRPVFSKVLLFTAFLFGIAFLANAQGTHVNLIVTTLDGTEQTFALTEESRLHFENGETLVIEDGTGTTQSYPLSNLRKLVCSEVTGTPENLAEPMQVFPNPTPNQFIIRNLSETGLARIYSLDGRLLKVFQATEGGVVDLSGFSEGMYLLHLNGQTLKLMKL